MLYHGSVILMHVSRESRDSEIEDMKSKLIIKTDELGEASRKSLR